MRSSDAIRLFVLKWAVHSLDVCFQFECKSYTVNAEHGDCALTAINHVGMQMSSLNLFTQCITNHLCACQAKMVTFYNYIILAAISVVTIIFFDYSCSPSLTQMVKNHC